MQTLRLCPDMWTWVCLFAVLSYLTFCVSVGIQEPCVIRGVTVPPVHLFCVCGFLLLVAMFSGELLSITFICVLLFQICFSRWFFTCKSLKTKSYFCNRKAVKVLLLCTINMYFCFYTHTHTHTHTYIYIWISLHSFWVKFAAKAT